MKAIFGSDSKVSFKEGNIRIAEKLTDLASEKTLKISECWYELTDILRMQVVCKSQQELLTVL